MSHCEHCVFFKIIMVPGPTPGDRLIGHCHRFPPPEGQHTPLKAAGNAVKASPFPIVQGSAWCGEFRQATTPVRRRAAPFTAEAKSPDLRLLVSSAEAAKMLGISERHLFSFAATGNLPRVLIGRRVCFRIETLREWIAGNEIR